MKCPNCGKEMKLHQKFVENVYGFVYEGFTNNFEWFLKTFEFKN